MNTKLTIRPYARLLTMLGDQLIKNEQIAVLELIKNAYDADSEWVLLSFENFNSDGSSRADSKIVIEDNGEGMTKDIIEKAWMSPATPNKFSNDGKVRLTKKKRIVQGEKGIGRYAMLKLGHKIKMTTRPVNMPEEYSILLDFSSYGEDYVSSGEDSKNMYLDELAFELNVSSPKEFIERPVFVGNHKFDGANNSHGTKLEITELQGKWNNAKITAVAKGFVQFGDFFNEIIKEKDTNDFRIGVYVNNEPMLLKSSNETTLANLIDSESVFQIKDGHYDSKKGIFKYCQNGVEKVLDCNSSEIRGLKVFRNAFFDKEAKSYREISNFGDFDFDFYIFDFNAKLFKKEREEGQPAEMAERYLTKLFPHSQRVYMPDIEDLLNRKLVITSHMKTCEFPSVQQCVPELIFQKTRYLFYNSPVHASYIVPRNLRDLRQIIKLLWNMDDYKESMSKNFCILKEGKYNQEVFKKLKFLK